MAVWAFFLSFVFVSIIAFVKRNNFLLTIWSFAFLLFVLEIGFWVGDYIIPKPKVKYASSIPYKEKDPILTFWHKPNAHALSSSYIETTVIFENVPYKFDPKGRRNSISIEGQPSRHALFFGGSFTFGAGVAQDQTLPSNFQRSSSDLYHSYNYGGDGFGPGAMFVQLDRDELFDDITLTKGIAVYSFIAAHLTRSTAYELEYYRITYENPFFFLDEQNGQLHGPMAYSQKDDLRRIFYVYRNLWKHSYLFRFVAGKMNPTYISKDRAMRTTVKILIESKDKYKRRFDGDFYVLLWPRRNDLLDIQTKAVMIQLLAEEDIQVIDVPPMQDERRAILHQLDPHPSAKEYQWVAQHLYENIR
ncbi:MAG: hypothetical protein NPIRA01_23210 [Nitrospirales bacterium]|nr:MAG: hypothetical protein NPIRA01_23210 [Nitrospirales bacterium]